MHESFFEFLNFDFLKEIRVLDLYVMARVCSFCVSFHIICQQSDCLMAILNSYSFGSVLLNVILDFMPQN